MHFKSESQSCLLLFAQFQTVQKAQNDNLVDIRYIVEKIKNRHIITKIEWEMPVEKYAEWVVIQQEIRKRYIS